MLLRHKYDPNYTLSKFHFMELTVISLPSKDHDIYLRDNNNIVKNKVTKLQRCLFAHQISSIPRFIYNLKVLAGGNYNLKPISQ